MKKMIFNILLVCSLLNCYGQEERINLKVYGNCLSNQPIIGQKITLKFTVDKNKCDPNFGFISMEDKLFHFEESLKSKEINFSDFERSLKSGVSGNIETEIYSYFSQEKGIKNIIELAKNQEVIISNVQIVHKEKSLDDQDEDAICALQSVIKKANYIAESLGYKHCDLKSVDDDTSFVDLLVSSSVLVTMSIDDIIDGGSIYSIVGYFEIY